MDSEYVRFGALGLAAITLVGAFILCRMELKRRSQTHARMQTILTLIGLTSLLVWGCIGLEVVNRGQAVQADRARVASADIAARESYQREIGRLKSKAMSDLGQEQLSSSKELVLLKAENATLKQGRGVAVREAQATLQRIEQGRNRLTNSLAADPTLRSELFWQLNSTCKALQKIRSSLGDSIERDRCEALLSESTP